MGVKSKINKFLKEKNPLAVLRRKAMRKRLTNTTPSFLCPNCIGGILFHDLGLRFCSPTVNLMITQTDFVKFVREMPRYLEQEFAFFDHPDHACPCAKLDDIVVHFTHYATPKDAVDKWNARATRIDSDNLFIFMTQRDGITKEDILSLKDVKAKGIVVFTAERYEDIPYTVFIEKYAKDGEVGNILSRSVWNDSREYERYFDFVKWFNEAAGGDYDVSAYVK